MKLEFLGDGQKIELPNNADDARVRKQIEFIAVIVRQRYGCELTGTDDDLAIVQQMLDDRVFDKSQTYELQSLGLVFGEAIRKKLGLEWVAVEDIYGRDPALQFRKSSVTLFPLTMISKRVEDGKCVDVRELALGLQDIMDEHLGEADESQVGKDTLLNKLRRKLPF